jgi:hypothetical protein
MHRRRDRTFLEALLARRRRYRAGGASGAVGAVYTTEDGTTAAYTTEDGSAVYVTET